MVSAETLPTILGAGHGKSSSPAISHTLGVSDFMVANIRKLDASKNTSASVLVATIVLPAVDVVLAGGIGGSAT